MRKILGIARYTFTEIFRNKVYYVLILFAFVLVGAAFLLGALGGEQKDRMIIDFGLAAIESFSLLIAVFAATTLVLEEMETKTLYLILTRPVDRWEFILGRYLGLVLVLTATYVAMIASHLVILKIGHVALDSGYALSLLYSWEKIVLITAIGMAFSLFATSTLSALAFTFFFWIMGHFSSEMRYLAHRTSRPMVSFLFHAFYYLAPNFQIMNLRDLPSASQAGTGWLWPAAGYGLCYTVSCLALVILLFRKKEF